MRICNLRGTIAGLCELGFVRRCGLPNLPCPLRSSFAEAIGCRHSLFQSHSFRRDIGRGVEARFLPVPSECNVGEVPIQRLAGKHEAAVDGAALGAVDADGEAVIEGWVNASA